MERKKLKELAIVHSFNIIFFNILVGKTVYYYQKTYGKYIFKWDEDEDRAEFLLDLNGQKFWSNPFIIQIIP